MSQVRLSHFLSKTQEQKEQYDACNASVSDGTTVRSGECLGNFSTADSFSQAILSDGDIKYRIGETYYFFSQ